VKDDNNSFGYTVSSFKLEMDTTRDCKFETLNFDMKFAQIITIFTF